MLGSTNRTGRGGVAAMAAVLATLLAVTALAVTGGQAGASGGRSGERQPEDLATCFAFSIDQVGRGDLEAGIERFDGCLAEDYTFEFVFFEGGPSDYTIQAVRERGRWKVQSEAIVGTAFLNFDGAPVGS